MDDVQGFIAFFTGLFTLALLMEAIRALIWSLIMGIVLRRMLFPRKKVSRGRIRL